MKPAAPAMKNLARHLLTLEAGGSERAAAGASAALSVLAKLRLHLTKLVGLAGFEALLSRALALARAEAGWLEGVRIQADATLEGFSEKEQQHSTATVEEGCTVLLAQLLGLLVTFIGDALTLRLVQDVWPEARLDIMNLGGEETLA